LNAATTKGNIRKLSSQKAIAEINLTYKYVENGEYTEIYDENGNLLFKDKSYIPEPNITTSAMKVKIILKNGKKIPVTEQYFPSGKIRAITEYNLKVKDEDIEKNDIILITMYILTVVRRCRSKNKKYAPKKCFIKNIILLNCILNLIEKVFK